MRTYTPYALLFALLAGFVLTVDRVPIDWPDGALYASIARSHSISGSGVPSVLPSTAGGVDHERLYGPVFFTLVAASFRWLGFSLTSFRLVSLIGALIVAVAGALMAGAFSAGAERQAWTAAFLLLTPEIGTTATSGRMDSLAAGSCTLALAVSVKGLVESRRPHVWGAAAGVLLATAALTTPRALPFVASFAVAGIVLAWMPGQRRRAAAAQHVTGLLVCAALVAAWATHAYGSVLGWMRYLYRIVLVLDVDVALAVIPDTVRDWRFSIPAVLSPLAAVIVGIPAAVGLGERRHECSEHAAAIFALLATGLNFLALLAIFNGTFAFGIYFAIPLLALTIALPLERLGFNRSMVLTLAAALLIGNLGIRLAKYAGAGLSWAARDPKPIERFVTAHVPAGSEVIGEPSFYLYAVEQSGSRMMSAQPFSRADWANVAPGVVAPAGRSSQPPGARRFFLWPVDEPMFVMPREYDCVRPHIAAVFDPPPVHVGWLGRFALAFGTPGYPKSVLYAVPPGCPSEVNATMAGTATSR